MSMLSVLLSAIFGCSAVSSATDAYNNLLPKSYNRQLHPGEQYGNVTEVRFHMSVINMNVIERPEENYLDAEIFLSTKWLDHRLRNVTERQFFILPLEYFKQLWRPQVFFRSASDVKLINLPTNNELVRVYHTNLVLHMSKLNVRIPCPMDKSKFPHDTQICRVLIESVSYTENDLLFKWDILPIKIGTDGLTSFNLVDSTSSAYSEKYVSGTFSCLELNLILERKVVGYLVKIYVPIWILVFISWISLFLDLGEIRDKVTIGVGVVICIILLQNGMFHSQSDLTALDTYVIYCIVQTLTCLIVSFIGYKCRDTEKDAVRKAVGIVSLGFPLGFVVFNIAYWIMMIAE